ncbi:MAG TPA: DUF58 domain-containing protein [Thermomicrobiales bacterium]|nr:DUF58 domain-containing protein [Thermomicrobiales bacterium]
MAARAQVATPKLPGRWTRLREWWWDPEADVNIQRWLGVAVLLAVIGAFLKQPLLFLLAFGVAVAGLGARLWWDNAFRNLTFTRSFSKTRAFYADELTMELTVVNTKPLPITRFEVSDEVTANLDIERQVLERSERSDRRLMRSVFSLGMYERVVYRYRIHCHHRGWHRFGPAKAVAVDPFGIVSRRQEIPYAEGFLVYPRIVPVTSLIVPPRQPYGDFRPSQQLIEDPMRMAGVREYVPGDSPRRIHWRATARTGVMQTRVFEPTASPIAAIFLDTITFSYLWEGQNSDLLELAITVTASLSTQLLADRHQVGFYANAPIPERSRTVRVPPGRRPGQTTRILENLAMLTPAFGERIEEMVVKELPRLPWGAAVVIVTTRVTEAMQRTLLRLSRTSGSQRFVLVVVGDVPELVPEFRKRIAVHHMGAEEAWNVIEHISLTRLV